MPFEPLVDAWEKGRQERTWMKPGERSLAMEKSLGGPMPTHRWLDWLLPARQKSEPEPDDRERE